MENQDQLLVDVEEPHQDPITIPLSQAINEYMLDAEDVNNLMEGWIVWFKDIALTLHKEE
jgi:hypothetical protein